MRPLIILALFASTAFGVQEFYSVAKSIRALGMGNAFYGLSDDENALFYNPAGLAHFRGSGEFNFAIKTDSAFATFSAIGPITQNMSNTLNLVNALSNFSGQPLYAGVSLLPYYVRKNFAVAVLLPDLKSDVTILGSNVDMTADVTGIADAGVVMGYAMTFNNFRIGASAKALYRMGGTKNYNVVDLLAGTPVTISDLGGGGGGVDFDLGASYEITELPWGIYNRVGLSFNNLLGSTFPILPYPNAGAPPALPRMFSLGFHSVFKGVGVIDNFHVMLDFAEFGIGGESDANRGARSGSFWKHVNMGVEVPIRGWLLLRTGFHQGNITAGIGFRAPFLKLDLATYAEEVGSNVDTVTSRRYALLLTLGGGSSPLPPITHAGQNDAAKETNEKKQSEEEKTKSDQNQNKTLPSPVSEDMGMGLDEWMDDLP